MSAIEERLLEEGLLPAEARRKRELFESVDAALRERTGAAPERRWFVPGRIEVLGKHTDYAGGRSLLCAVGRGFCVAGSRRGDGLFRIADAGRGLSAEVELGGPPDASGSGWTVFARTVASRAGRNFPGAGGADVAFASDLPRASGMSSSSALVVSLFTALADLHGLERRPEWVENIRTSEDLAGYLSGVENGSGFAELSGDRGVGTRSGSEDPTAILCSQAGRISQFAFRPVRFERAVALDETWSFVVAASGVASDKTGDAREPFNRLALSAEEVLSLWNRSTGRQDETLFAALAGGPDVPERIRALLRLLPSACFPADVLVKRFDQFVEETLSLVPGAGDALDRGEVGLFGEVVDRSQSLAESHLSNQVPETVALARSARELGAAAASAFGGGFGGSVWALARTSEADAFRRRWAERYAGEFPAVAEASRFFVTRPGPPLVRL